MPSLKEVCGLDQSGEIDFDMQDAAIKDCIEACMEGYGEMRQCLYESFKTPEDNLQMGIHAPSKETK